MPIFDPDVSNFSYGFRPGRAYRKAYFLISIAAYSTPHETPGTEPYARWCGRRTPQGALLPDVRGGTGNSPTENALVADL
jgi:hypothetical protein